LKILKPPLISKLRESLIEFKSVYWLEVFEGPEDFCCPSWVRTGSRCGSRPQLQ